MGTGSDLTAPYGQAPSNAMRRSGRAYEEREDGAMNGRVIVGIVLASLIAGCSAAAPTSTTELSDSNRHRECLAMPKLRAAACPADGRSALP
jgi:hypothetical protein